jgi:hypothetical protein
LTGGRFEIAYWPGMPPKPQRRKMPTTRSRPYEKVEWLQQPEHGGACSAQNIRGELMGAPGWIEVRGGTVRGSVRCSSSSGGVEPPVGRCVVWPWAFPAEPGGWHATATILYGRLI